MEDVVLVYSKNNCAQCRATKQFLDRNDVVYKEVNLDEHPEEIDTVKAMGFSSLPVVVAKGVQPFFGFRPDILEEL